MKNVLCCVSIISRVDKNVSDQQQQQHEGVGRKWAQVDNLMLGIYGNLPTSAILDIFHSERGQRREDKNSLLFFFYPLFFFFFFLYSLGLILFSFVSPSSRRRRRPGRLNRSRKKKHRRKNTWVSPPPLERRRTFSSQDRTANILLHTHTHTRTYEVHYFYFLWKKRKGRRCGIKGGPLIKDGRGGYIEDYKKKRERSRMSLAMKWHSDREER